VIFTLIIAVIVMICRRRQRASDDVGFVPRGFSSSPPTQRGTIFDDRNELRNEFSEQRAVAMQPVSLPSYSSDPYQAERDYERARNQKLRKEDDDSDSELQSV
jgi:hypothetical protein